jgi:hypothetical protein
MKKENYFDDDYYEEPIETEDNTPPDCLVLEIYVNNQIFDERKRVFVWYDSYEHRFFLRGKNDDNEIISYNPFNFKSKRGSHVADFLNLIIDKRSILEVALYNFMDLPLSSNDITYEMLLENEYAEVIYTNENYPLKHHKLRELMNTLTTIYNSY